MNDSPYREPEKGTTEYMRHIWAFYTGQGEAFDRWLAEHDRQVAEKAWDDSLNAVAWCIEHGSPDFGDALSYTAKNNPYRVFAPNVVETGRSDD